MDESMYVCVHGSSFLVQKAGLNKKNADEKMAGSQLKYAHTTSNPCAISKYKMNTG